MKLSRWALVAAPFAVAACGGFGSAMTAHTDVVAKAAGKELKVEDAAQLLAANPQIPADPQVVRTLADLWVDYTLLATAAAEDSTLSVLDLEKFVEEERENTTVRRFVESNVRVDTTFTDQEVDQMWATEGPGTEIRARHILFSTGGMATGGAEVTPQQRQAKRQQAEAVARRAAAGEDFAALAREFTEEPGGKERGGDLDWFGRGRMVAQFEEAAFKLQPGQVSPVVETPFGYHIIKVEDRRQQPLGENREAFRQDLKNNARQRAVNAFVDSLKKVATVTVQPGAAAAIKELAGQENLSLRGRAASRSLVTYRGGEVTTGEIAEMLQGASMGDRESMKDATEEQIKPFLEDQGLREFLLAEARARNFRLSNAAVDSIRTDARSAIRQVLQMSGFAGRSFPRGRAGEGAIQEAVRQLMQQAVAGQRQLPPLGRLSYALRNAYGADVNTAAFARVVDRIKAIRAAQPGEPSGPVPAMPPGTQPRTPPAQQQGQQGQQPAPAQPAPAQPQAAPAQPQAAPAQPQQAPAAGQNP
ncbi:MAG TPA: peptidylprolyl isomerase [Longimicrobium sp.]|nr:peptidylprolyl isomerase [Longimicrobium sp.]